MRVFQIEMQYTRPAGPLILSYTRIMQEKKKKRAAVECVAYRIFSFYLIYKKINGARHHRGKALHLYYTRVDGI